MRRSVATILVPVLMAALSGCTAEKVSAGAPPAAGAVPVRKLRLDDGKKWPVNEATHVCMGTMRQLLDDSPAAAAKDFIALGKSLQEQTRIIISKCDMTGDSHDQLHIVLNPMFVAIQQLESGKGGSAERATLRKLMTDYEAHFGR